METLWKVGASGIVWTTPAFVHLKRTGFPTAKIRAVQGKRGAFPPFPAAYCYCYFVTTHTRLRFGRGANLKGGDPMKFRFETKDFQTGVLSVTKALPLRSTMPVLDGILIEAKENSVRLLCSDLMLQKECFLPCMVEEEGRCVVPGKLFPEILRKLPQGEVNVTTEGMTLYLRCASTKNQVQCIAFDSFPEMSFGKDRDDLTMDRELCREMIERSAFALSAEDSRPFIAGGLVETKGNDLTLVATDSYHLALRHASFDHSMGERSTIVQGKTLMEIAHMMEETDKDEITLSFTKTHIKVDLGELCLIARLLDGNYIDYRRLIPVDCRTRVLIDREEILQSVDRAQLIARGGSNSIIFSVGENCLTVKAESILGKLEDDFELTVVGDPIDIAFNPKYCINILRAIEDEKVYMEFTTNISPCVFRPVQGDRYAYLIVPMRIF